MNDSEATFLPAGTTIKPISIPSTTILASASSSTTFTDQPQVNATTADCHAPSTSALSSSSNYNWSSNHHHPIHQQRPCGITSQGDVPLPSKCGSSGQAVEVEYRRAIDKSASLLHHGSTGSTIL